MTAWCRWSRLKSVHAHHSVQLENFQEPDFRPLRVVTGYPLKSSFTQVAINKLAYCLLLFPPTKSLSYVTAGVAIWAARSAALLARSSRRPNLAPPSLRTQDSDPGIGAPPPPTTTTAPAPRVPTDRPGDCKAMSRRISRRTRGKPGELL